MNKINRKNEAFAKADLYRNIPIGQRTMAQHHAVNVADCLQRTIDGYPERLRWTFDIAPGTQLYVTGKDESKGFGPEIGDILILNQCTGFHDMVGCNNANGLGTSARRCDIRLARPNDPGFMDTREGWDRFLDAKVKQLNVESFAGWALSLALLGALVFKSL